MFKQYQVKGARIIYCEQTDSPSPDQAAFDPRQAVLFARLPSPLRLRPVEIYIKPPYRSPNLDYAYEDGELMELARRTFASIPLEDCHLTVTLLAKDGELLGLGTNAAYHLRHGCRRLKHDLPTGVGYDRCPGCRPPNHSEQQALAQAAHEDKDENLPGATAYLYGHWWSCQSCTQALETAGVKRIVFSKTWTRDFLGLHPENPDPPATIN
jgi:deoxycytidylate deaminase